MKIHNQSIKRFMGISAATLLLLSVSGSAINATNNANADTFNNFVKQMSNEGPSKSDIADEKVTYNNVLKDSIKHPKEMKANETILQDNSLFHKKSFEKAVKQGINKRTPKTKRTHKAKQPKWKQVKAIKNSLKQINRKINKIAHHKYHSKRTKRNARRTLNHLKQQLRNDNKQLNQLTHKHSTKRHRKVRKYNIKRYKRHVKNRK